MELIFGLQADFRTDGRSRLEYRAFEIETNVMPQTNGSVRLRIANTDVLVTVKVEIDSPTLDRPNEGKIEFFVDCSANATPEFEGKGGEELGSEISNVLTNAYQSSNGLDLTMLCILPHKKCWKMYIDVLILQCDGNLFDAIGAAVKCALFATEIPKLTTAEVDGDDADIQLSDDPFDCIRLNVDNYPVLVTLCKIGDNCVVDPTTDEELCAAANVVVSVTPKGRITSIVKTGYGSLQTSTLLKTLESGKEVGKRLNETLMAALRKEEALGPQRPIFGFLG
ncbi:exosome complex exonuclease RRP42 isoform X2 [Fopius arisanus]|uniref:Ribosomal RNA-processing protein 42 n=1 Tax=Fopius arisanus TaxID=64838 RepID=A0A9R1TC15_9HYME|nr:PREDICTED: exosome complex exonuclease RRP42 isoform X2 [Fopius arisanus]